MARILVVDDRADARKFLVQLLGSAGHSVLEASDGAEAFYRAQAERPDLIISDILMPTMDGYEFVRRLRADPTLERTPVIFFSAMYHDGEAKLLAAACGVRNVLSKPSRPDVILQIVNQSLGLMPLPVPHVKDETFEEEHLHLLTDKLVKQVGELEVVAGKLARLVEVSQELALEPDSSRLVQRCCEAVREIIGARHAAIGILAEDGRTFHPFLLCGGDAGKSPSPGVDVELFRPILTEQRAVREDNLGEGCRAAGLPPGHPRQGSFLGVPINSAGKLYGILYLIGKLGDRGFNLEDLRLATSLAAQLSSAYGKVLHTEQLKRTNMQLEQEVAQRMRAEEDLKGSAVLLRVLSRQLMEAQEIERRSIARELHDEIGQALSTLRLNLHVLKETRSAENRASCLEDSVGLVEQTLQQVRDLSLNLRPSILDDLGLFAALEWQLNKLAASAGFRAQLSVEGLPSRLPAVLETTCFRVVQEALTNIVRHAQAQQVTVTARQDDQDLVLTVRDDGMGFDVKAADERAKRGGSMGLVGMRERIQFAGGAMSLRSSPGSGTEIRVRFPLTDWDLRHDSTLGESHHAANPCHARR